MERLNPNCIGSVAVALGGPYYSVCLRAANKRLRGLVPCVPKKYKSPEKFLEHAARDNDLALCDYVKNIDFIGRIKPSLSKIPYRWDQDYDFKYSAFNSAFCDILLLGAARGGHAELCKLAKRIGATYFNLMCEEGARGNHKDICDLALEWGITNKTRLLYGAVRNGHLGLCCLPKEGIDNWQLNCLGYEAGLSGRTDMCHLVKSWGTNYFNPMITGAAHKGHRHICILAKKWGAGNFDQMLHCGAIHGHDDICKLARKWGGGGKLCTVLYDAACGGHLSTCELLVGWLTASKRRCKLGLRNIEKLLVIGSRNGHMDICRLARKLGARNYKEALKEIGYSEWKRPLPKTKNLLLSWIEEEKN